MAAAGAAAECIDHRPPTSAIVVWLATPTAAPPEGFQAQAELVRRVIAALADTKEALDAHRAEAAATSAAMTRYTRWLVWLTVILAALGVRAILATISS